MSVANETRSKVSTTVGAAKTTPVSTQTMKTPPRSSESVQVNTQADQKVNPSEDMKVNHQSPDERYDYLVNKPAPFRSKEENEELEILQKEREKKAGAIERNKDRKEGDANLDPIKIEEGDIIKYMMKDIVLASAGWLGGKACGFVGYYIIYKPTSATYHYLDDKFNSKKGAKAAKVSGNEAYKKFEIQDSDDKTTAFTKRVGYNYAKKIEQIETSALLSTINLQTLLDAAIDNKLNAPFKLRDPETGEEKDYASLTDALKTIPMTDPQQTTQMLQHFRQLAQNNPTKTTELKQQAQSSVQIAINHQMAQMVFEEQYASAMLIQNMQRDPQYLGIQDPKKLTETEKERFFKEKKLHKGNAKLLFTRMHAEYHRNPPSELTKKLQKEYSSFSEFVGIAALALEHAQKTTENGQYVEKGKNPEERKNILRRTKTNPNEALDHLNELMGIKKVNQSSNEQHTTMQQAAQDLSRRSQALKTDDLDRNINALEGELTANDEKRKRVQKTKDKAKGKSSYQEEQQNQTSTVNAINNTQRHGATHV